MSNILYVLEEDKTAAGEGFQVLGLYDAPNLALKAAADYAKAPITVIPTTSKPTSQDIPVVAYFDVKTADDKQVFVVYPAPVNAPTGNWPQF